MFQKISIISSRDSHNLHHSSSFLQLKLAYSDCHNVHAYVYGCESVYLSVLDNAYACTLVHMCLGVCSIYTS